MKGQLFELVQRHHLSYRQGWGSICHMPTMAAWKPVSRERSLVDTQEGQRWEMAETIQWQQWARLLPASHAAWLLNPIVCDRQMFLPMPCLNLTLIINSSNLLRLGWTSFYNLCSGMTFLKYAPICFFILAFPYSPVFLFFFLFSPAVCIPPFKEVMA